MACSDRTDVGYWVTIVVLLILGYFTGFTIGPIFWFVAAVMIVLAPFKSRPRIFRTGVALFAGFIIGFLLVAPSGCSQTASGDVETGEQSLTGGLFQHHRDRLFRSRTIRTKRDTSAPRRWRASRPICGSNLARHGPCSRAR